MSLLRFKFKSSAHYEQLEFDGVCLQVSELKRLVHEKRGSDPDQVQFDLVVSDAHSNKVYDDNDIVSKNSTLLIQRVPKLIVTPMNKSRLTKTKRQESKALKQMINESILPFKSLQSGHTNAHETEDDKLRNIIFGTGPQDQSNDANKNLNGTSAVSVNMHSNSRIMQGTPGPNYTCYKCGIKGHYINFCPKRDNNKIDLLSNPKLADHMMSTRALKSNHGIPSSFMVKTNDPTLHGTRRMNDGTLGVNIKDSIAFLEGKREKNPFDSKNQQNNASNAGRIPAELTCQLCDNLFSDASVVICCGHSYCDMCIRSYLLQNEEQICPNCKSPTDLSKIIVNVYLRNAVTKFKSENMQDSGALKMEEKASDSPSNITTTQKPSANSNAISSQASPVESPEVPLKSVPDDMNKNLTTQNEKTDVASKPLTIQDLNELQCKMYSEKLASVFQPSSGFEKKFYKEQLNKLYTVYKNFRPSYTCLANAYLKRRKLIETFVTQPEKETFDNYSDFSLVVNDKFFENFVNQLLSINRLSEFLGLCDEQNDFVNLLDEKTPFEDLEAEKVLKEKIKQLTKSTKQAPVESKSSSSSSRHNRKNETIPQKNDRKSSRESSRDRSDRHDNYRSRQRSRRSSTPPLHHRKTDERAEINHNTSLNNIDENFWKTSGLGGKKSSKSNNEVSNEICEDDNHNNVKRSKSKEENTEENNEISIQNAHFISTPIKFDLDEKGNVEKQKIEKINEENVHNMLESMEEGELNLNTDTEDPMNNVIEICKPEIEEQLDYDEVEILLSPTEFKHSSFKELTESECYIRNEYRMTRGNSIRRGNLLSAALDPKFVSKSSRADHKLSHSRRRH